MCWLVLQEVPNRAGAYFHSPAGVNRPNVRNIGFSFHLEFQAMVKGQDHGDSEGQLIIFMLFFS
jgi:hypothetical protein